MGCELRHRWYPLYNSNDAVTTPAMRKRKVSMVGWSAALKYSAMRYLEYLPTRRIGRWDR
jgi:hypothetical protein